MGQAGGGGGEGGARKAGGGRSWVGGGGGKKETNEMKRHVSFSTEIYYHTAGGWKVDQRECAWSHVPGAGPPHSSTIAAQYLSNGGLLSRRHIRYLSGSV